MSKTQRLIRSLMAGVFAALALMGTAHAQEARQPEAPTRPGLPLTNPACASWGPDRVDCFVIGTDGRMYHSYSDQASGGDYRDFSPWIEEPSPPRSGFDPIAGLGVTAWGPGRLDIMAIDGSGIVMHRYYDANAWQPSDWESLGFPGVEMTEIGCSSWGVNRIDCFTRGADRRIYQIRWDGWNWLWVDMGPLPTGTSVDIPYLGIAAAGYHTDILFMVVIALDGNVYHRKWNGAGWSAWANGGKPSGDSLTAVSCLAGVIYVMDCVFTDAAGRIWHRSYYDGAATWLSWHNLGALAPGVAGSSISGLGASKIVGDSGALYAMAYGVDGQIYLGFGRGGASTFDWYGWDSLRRPKDQRQFLPLVRR